MPTAPSPTTTHFSILFMLLVLPEPALSVSSLLSISFCRRRFSPSPRHKKKKEKQTRGAEIQVPLANAPLERDCRSGNHYIARVLSNDHTWVDGAAFSRRMPKALISTVQGLLLLVTHEHGAQCMAAGELKRVNVVTCPCSRLTTEIRARCFIHPQPPLVSSIYYGSRFLGGFFLLKDFFFW